MIEIRRLCFHNDHPATEREQKDLENNAEITALNHDRSVPSPDGISFQLTVYRAKPIVANPTSAVFHGRSHKTLEVKRPDEQLGWVVDTPQKRRWTFKNGNTLAIRRETVGCHDVLRGAVGASVGRHWWKVRWDPEQRGLNPVIGVAEVDSVCAGSESFFYPRAGRDEKSWVWQTHSCALMHAASSSEDDPTRPGREKCVAYPGAEFRDASGRYRAPYEISLLLDADDGTLEFAAGGVRLGTAFTGLRGKTLYPIAGTSWGSAAIELEYAGEILVKRQDGRLKNTTETVEKTYKRLKKTFVLRAESGAHVL